MPLKPWIIGLLVLLRVYFTKQDQHQKNSRSLSSAIPDYNDAGVCMFENTALAFSICGKMIP